MVYLFAIVAVQSESNILQNMTILILFEQFRGVISDA